jgi:hypothetical protein
LHLGIFLLVEVHFKMGVTNIGLSGTALLLSVSGARPTYMSIGAGSKNENANVTTMGSEALRYVFSSTTISTAKRITWTADYGSVAMSGLNFREFGLMTGSPGTEIWHYVNLGNGVNFDGSNELRVELNWTFY